MEYVYLRRADEIKRDLDALREGMSS
jgi:hypothetical protein